jgi:hypothetical protein
MLKNYEVNNVVDFTDMDGYERVGKIVNATRAYLCDYYNYEIKSSGTLFFVGPTSIISLAKPKIPYGKLMR